LINAQNGYTEDSTEQPEENIKIKENVFDTEIANSIMRYCPSNKNEDSKYGIEKSNLSLEIIINGLEKEFKAQDNIPDASFLKIDLNKKLKSLEIQSTNNTKTRNPIKLVTNNKKACLRTNNQNAFIPNNPFIQTSATLTSRDNSKRPITIEEPKIILGSNTNLKMKRITGNGSSLSDLKNLKVINNYPNIIIPDVTHISINNNYYNCGPSSMQKTIVISDYREKHKDKINSARDRNRKDNSNGRANTKDDFLTLRASNSNIARLFSSQGSKSEFTSPKPEHKKFPDYKNNYNKVLKLIQSQKNKDPVISPKRQIGKQFNTIDRDSNSIKNNKYISYKDNNELITDRKAVKSKLGMKGSVI
jgi:hypothetical protein